MKFLTCKYCHKNTKTQNYTKGRYFKFAYFVVHRTFELSWHSYFLLNPISLFILK